MLPPAAREHYLIQQRINRTAANEARRAWRAGMRSGSLRTGWLNAGPVIVRTLVRAQDEAARAALDYVPRLLVETDTPDLPEGEIRGRALVGVASDGRRLDTLAAQSVRTTAAALRDGATQQQALQQGENWLDLMVKLQVADVARQVVGMMTTVRPNLEGTVRVLTPPSCQRCAILAGRWYRWSTGFLRHPRCDCQHFPARSQAWAEAEGFIADPMQAYRDGHIRDLTAAQRFAIDNGANMNRVVNATRNMSTTTTSINRGGARSAIPPIGVQPGMPDLLGFLPDSARFGGVPTPPTRLTPEGIYRQAAGSRREAIRLLRVHGYM
jgi:hypothetical protein